MRKKGKKCRREVFETTRTQKKRIGLFSTYFANACIRCDRKQTGSSPCHTCPIKLHGDYQFRNIKNWHILSKVCTDRLDTIDDKDIPRSPRS